MGIMQINWDKEVKFREVKKYQHLENTGWRKCYVY